MATEASLFATLVRPWIEKVEETKDLKPLRKADYFHDVKSLVGATQHCHAHDDVVIAMIRLDLPSLMDRIVLSDIGGKKMREDLWRRLKYWMLMH